MLFSVALGILSLMPGDKSQHGLLDTRQVNKAILNLRTTNWPSTLNRWRRESKNSDQIQTRNSFLGGSMVKNMPNNTGDAGDACSNPEFGRSLKVGNGKTLQYCLETPINSEVLWATVHRVTRSWTGLRITTTTKPEILLNWSTESKLSKCFVKPQSFWCCLRAQQTNWYQCLLCF